MRKTIFSPIAHILFAIVLFSVIFESYAQITPWVAQSYTGHDLINVTCGEDIIIAANIPNDSLLYIFDIENKHMIPNE